VYRQFFSLKEKPFELTPSPRFVYLGETHREALALLTYGCMEQKGFVLLTGEVGTGKTTMVQTVLANLDDRAEYVSIRNPVLSPDEFFVYLTVSILGERERSEAKARFLMRFEDYLETLSKRKKIFILIIDEAHRLSDALLEEIRLLSNLETPDEKLLNIFLVGQPEVNDKLSRPESRSLLQRIGVRYHMEPLGLEDTREYIMTRLRIAGAENGRKFFPEKAVQLIHRHSGGYPRTINIIADNAMLLGYARGKKKITPEMILECCGDLRLSPEISYKSSKSRWVTDGREGTAPSSHSRLEAALLALKGILGKVIHSQETLQGSQVSYIGNSRSRRFHRPGCALMRRASSRNVLRFKDRKEAVTQGFRACMRCKP
jgi:general secretion pathway protein A